MNPTTLFYALSHAIWISLVQGIFIYLTVRLIFLTFTNIASAWRYRLLYSAISLMCLGFIIAFSQAYTPIIPHSASFFGREQSITDVLSLKNILQRYSFEITGLYLTGLTIHVCLLLSGLYQVSSIRNKEKQCVDTVWETKFKLLCQKLKIRQKAALYFTEHLAVPLTVGFLKPIILFPVAMANQLSTEQVEAILLHELAHIKRHDYLLNILQRVMEIILFFNPITWLLAKSIKEEREFCCDDLVLNYINPGIYARALLIIEESRQFTYSLTMAASGNEKHTLLNRIKRLKIMKTENPYPKQRLLALLSLVAISLSLAWVMPTDTTKVKLHKHKSISKLPAPPPPPAPAHFPAPVLVPPPAPAPGQVPPPPPAPPAKIKRVPSHPIDTNEVSKYFKSPEWKKQQEAIKKQAEELSKHFNNPEWKMQMEAIKKQVETLSKQFNSPEWKKQQEMLARNGEELNKKFNSPEWKMQMEKLKKQGEEINKKFESPEWKKQMEEIGKNIEKQFNSEDWKKKEKEMQKQAEEMSKKFNSPEWKQKIEEMKKVEKETQKEKTEKQ